MRSRLSKNSLVFRISVEIREVFLDFRAASVKRSISFSLRSRRSFRFSSSELLSLFVSLLDELFDGDDSRTDIVGLLCHVDQIPVVAAMLEAGPVTVATDFRRRAVEVEVDAGACCSIQP